MALLVWGCPDVVQADALRRASRAIHADGNDSQRRVRSESKVQALYRLAESRELRFHTGLD